MLSFAELKLELKRELNENIIELKSIAEAAISVRYAGQAWAYVEECMPRVQVSLTG